MKTQWQDEEQNLVSATRGVNLIEISVSQLFQADAGLMRVALFLSSVLKDQAACSQVAWKRNQPLSEVDMVNYKTIFTRTK